MDDPACCISLSEAENVLAWLSLYRKTISCSVEQIPFSDSRQWSLDESRSALRHTSGKFFTIQGYRATSSHRADFFQPLINQPEIHRTSQRLQL